MKPLCEMKSPDTASIWKEEEEGDVVVVVWAGMGLKCPLNRPTCNK